MGEDNRRMTHDFDPRSLFCRVCQTPIYAVHNHSQLIECTPESATKWQAEERLRVERIARETSVVEESRKIDAELVPVGATWGDLRRAMARMWETAPYSLPRSN